MDFVSTCVIFVAEPSQSGGIVTDKAQNVATESRLELLITNKTQVALLDKFLHGRSWTHHRNMSFLCLARNKAGITYMDIPQVLRLNIADVVFYV